MVCDQRATAAANQVAAVASKRHSLDQFHSTWQAGEAPAADDGMLVWGELHFPEHIIDPLHLESGGHVLREAEHGGVEEHVPHGEVGEEPIRLQHIALRGQPQLTQRHVRLQR